MESFFDVIANDSIIFNTFFDYSFICKKWVSELRIFGTTVQSSSDLDKLTNQKLDSLIYAIESWERDDGKERSDWALNGCAIGYPSEELTSSIRPPIEEVTLWIE
jgi:hypothetical protein